MRDGAEGVTVIGHSAGAPVVEIDLDTCDDVHLLARTLYRRADSLRALLTDPEWAIRMDAPGTREGVLDEIAKVGMLLARLTELITLPPEEARERGLNARALREADNIIDLARRRAAVSA